MSAGFSLPSVRAAYPNSNSPWHFHAACHSFCGYFLVVAKLSEASHHWQLQVNLPECSLHLTPISHYKSLVRKGSCVQFSINVQQSESHLLVYLVTWRESCMKPPQHLVSTAVSCPQWQVFACHPHRFYSSSPVSGICARVPSGCLKPPIVLGLECAVLLNQNWDCY